MRHDYAILPYYFNNFNPFGKYKGTCMTEPRINRRSPNSQGQRETDNSTDTNFNLCPHYDRYEMSEEQVLFIAKKAVELAKEDMYKFVKKEFSAELGSTILSKLAYMVGASVLGVFMWLASHGFIKL